MGDYQRDTGALSITEHGVYFLMLQYHYATEKPLPKGRDLYRLLRCESKADRAAVDAVTAVFWVEAPEGWVNKRSLEEMTKASDQAETNRRIAQAREAKRKVERTKHEALHESYSDREPSHSHSSSRTNTNQPPNGGESLFDFAVTALGEQGIKEKTARSFIGSLLRDWDAPAVEAALRAAVGKAEVKAYVMGVLKEKPKKGQEKRVLI